jgi:hypothetical protein
MLSFSDKHGSRNALVPLRIKVGNKGVLLINIIQNVYDYLVADVFVNKQKCGGGTEAGRVRKANVLGSLEPSCWNETSKMPSA